MLSIIIPIYQSVNEIKKCVSSVMNQTVNDLEIILVDDGSTDGSDKICDELADCFSIIRTIHIDNSGIFQARLAGVKVCKGDYITFLDADDWIENNIYESISRKVIDEDIDIYIGAYIKDDGRIIDNNYPLGLYEKETIETIIIPNMMWDAKTGGRSLDPSLCCKVIRKKLYLEIAEDVSERISLGEDAVVTYPMICAAKRIYISNEPYYHYSNNENSCTRKFDPNTIVELQNFKTVIEGKLEKYKQFNFELQIQSYLRIFLNEYVKEWFHCNRTSQLYAFPYDLFDKGDKIILYGAGEVGKSYYCSIIQDKFMCLERWYDKNPPEKGNYNGFVIQKAKDFYINEDEVVLVAIRDENMYKKIKIQLIEQGVNEKAIVWKKPNQVG